MFLWFPFSCGTEWMGPAKGREAEKMKQDAGRFQKMFRNFGSRWRVVTWKEDVTNATDGHLKKKRPQVEWWHSISLFCLGASYPPLFPSHTHKLQSQHWAPRFLTWFMMWMINAQFLFTAQTRKVQPLHSDEGGGGGSMWPWGKLVEFWLVVILYTLI